jgi:hypothetical protein
VIRDNSDDRVSARLSSEPDNGRVDSLARVFANEGRSVFRADFASVRHICDAGPQCDDYRAEEPVEKGLERRVERPFRPLFLDNFDGLEKPSCGFQQAVRADSGFLFSTFAQR